MSGGRVDPVLAWALTTAALAGWWTTFAGFSWLLVGAVGAALGTLVVTLHARRGSLAWALVTVPLAYVVLGVAVLGVEFGGNGAPRADTLSRVLSGAWECWPLLVGTHPPVEATGTVLLAPALAGVFVAAMATGLALSRSRPGLAGGAAARACSPGCWSPAASSPRPSGCSGRSTGWPASPGWCSEPAGTAPAPGSAARPTSGGRSPCRCWWSARCSRSPWATASSATATTAWCCASRRRRTAWTR